MPPIFYIFYDTAFFLQNYYNLFKYDPYKTIEIMHPGRTDIRQPWRDTSLTSTIQGPFQSDNLALIMFVKITQGLTLDAQGRITTITYDSILF